MQANNGAVPGLSSCTDQYAKPPTFLTGSLDTALAWSRAARQAKTGQWPRFKEIRLIGA